MKTLYVFATSERPDVYINTIAHAIEHQHATAIYVIVVSEHDYSDEMEQSKLLASTVVANINEQLQRLATGKYIDHWHSDDRQAVPLEDRSNLDVYSRALEAMNRSGTTGIVIPIAKLDRTIREYVSKGDCIVDVSALKKNLLVDVVATLLSIGFSEVYSFELLKKQSHNQTDLYHSLRLDDEYIFRSLAKSDSVARSLRRINRWSARARAIMLFTALLATIFISLSLLWKDSKLLVALNIAAMVASIGSYLFLFVRQPK